MFLITTFIVVPLAILLAVVGLFLKSDKLGTKLTLTCVLLLTLWFTYSLVYYLHRQTLSIVQPNISCIGGITDQFGYCK